MRSGTTTMKMINSTSTTSTSGVTLISDCRLEPEMPPLTCMISVSPRVCAGALGDQPYPGEAGLIDREHGLPDHVEGAPRVAPDHDLGVGIPRGSAEAFAETFDGDLLIVDPEPSGLVDRDQDPAPFVALLARLRSLRQVDLRSLPHLRRHHHEDDQQHQPHVDERRDVDGRLHLGRLSEPHRPSPPSCPPAPCPPAP